MTVSTLTARVGQRVREAREAAQLTQAEVADLIGLTRTSVTNIEAGRQRLTLDHLVLLASALRVDAEWFFSHGPVPAHAPHAVTVQHVWKVTCTTCGSWTLDVVDSRVEADQVKAGHIKACREAVVA